MAVLKSFRSDSKQKAVTWSWCTMCIKSLHGRKKNDLYWYYWIPNKMKDLIVFHDILDHPSLRMSWFLLSRSGISDIGLWTDHGQTFVLYINFCWNKDTQLFIIIYGCFYMAPKAMWLFICYVHSIQTYSLSLSIYSVSFNKMRF